jgi:hypothetical protein
MRIRLASVTILLLLIGGQAIVSWCGLRCMMDAGGSHYAIQAGLHSHCGGIEKASMAKVRQLANCGHGSCESATLENARKSEGVLSLQTAALDHVPSDLPLPVIVASSPTARFADSHTRFHEPGRGAPRAERPAVSLRV